MEVILSREYRALRADRVIKTFTIGLPGGSGDDKVQNNPAVDVTSGMPLDYLPPSHKTVISEGLQ
jgi:hypothetical protein